jgi:pimeloyl-ACP methyl ester carboxylesterase
LGIVPIWGAVGGDGPVVLAMRGATPPPEQLASVPTQGANLLLLHLPGMYSPLLSRTSIEAFATAYDEVIAAVVPDRDIVALGVSTGAVVALGLRAPQIKAQVIVEPFFSTKKLWALSDLVRRGMKDHPVDHPLARWFDAIFGYTSNGVSDRDYSWVLKTPLRPTWALVGSVPLLPPRTLSIMPSLTDDMDRERLRACGARVCTVEGGHDLPLQSPAAIATAVAEALGSLKAG